MGRDRRCTAARAVFGGGFFCVLDDPLPKNGAGGSGEHVWAGDVGTYPAVTARNLWTLKVYSGC